MTLLCFTIGSVHFNLHNLLNLFEALKIMFNFTEGANFAVCLAVS